MAKYDLTGSLEKDFTFSINGSEYTFRKPTVREMRELVKKFTVIEKEEDEERQAALSEEAMEALYAYCQPVNNARPLAEVLDEQPVGVQQAFNDMIQAELGAKK
jgi:hypothetical protein